MSAACSLRESNRLVFHPALPDAADEQVSFMEPQFAERLPAVWSRMYNFFLWRHNERIRAEVAWSHIYDIFQSMLLYYLTTGHWGR